VVFYTNLFVRKGYAGITIGPFAFIRPKYKDDVGLRKHEEKHIEQFWRYFGWFPIFYLLSERFRLKVEVEAYREQLRYCSDDRTERFAWYIANKYRINITVAEAVKLLCTETNQG
jgi:hypothetical protein